MVARDRSNYIETKITKIVSLWSTKNRENKANAKENVLDKDVQPSIGCYGMNNRLTSQYASIPNVIRLFLPLLTEESLIQYRKLPPSNDESIKLQQAA